MRFTAFMSQLQNLSATLNKLDRDANADRSATFFRIAELSYSSPIRVVLEPQPLPKHPYAERLIIESLDRVADTFTNGGDLAPLDADLLEDIRWLASQVGKTVKNATLLFNGRELDFSDKITKQVNDALAVTEECDDSLDGMLEQLNVHLRANTFHIFPEIGPKKVTYQFLAKLYDDAVSAVGKREEVFGTLRYLAGANFPHQIAVSQIDAFPPDSELPDWDDLRGRAPEATGKLSSESFVRELRDGWR